MPPLDGGCDLPFLKSRPAFVSLSSKSSYCDAVPLRIEFLKFRLRLLRRRNRTSCWCSNLVRLVTHGAHKLSPRDLVSGLQSTRC